MKNLVILGMVGTIVFSSFIVNTCPITLINNTKNPILIHTNDTMKLKFTLGPMKKATFGNKDKHTEFSLIDLNPQQKAEFIMELRQRSCSADSPVMLKASDLLLEKFDNTLFYFDKTRNDTDQNNTSQYAG